jgi:hypothetical protein
MFVERNSSTQYQVPREWGIPLSKSGVEGLKTQRSRRTAAEIAGTTLEISDREYSLMRYIVPPNSLRIVIHDLDESCFLC